MIYIIIGTIGFLVIHFFDFISLKRIPWAAKPFTWILGSGLGAYSLTMICLSPDKLLLPSWITWLGWILLTISISLLIYSLFINLPFRKTYITTGISNKLVKTGLYALVRHPGLHWFIVLMLSLVFVSKSKLLLVAAPTFILLDIVLIIIQDKFLFVRMFDGYRNYQQETPMLVPNRRSIKTFVNLLKQSRP